MFIGSRVRELRKAKGLTQQDLADMINVTKVFVVMRKELGLQIWILLWI